MVLSWGWSPSQLAILLFWNSLFSRTPNACFILGLECLFLYIMCKLAEKYQLMYTLAGQLANVNIR